MIEKCACKDGDGVRSCLSTLAWSLCLCKNGGPYCDGERLVMTPFGNLVDCTPYSCTAAGACFTQCATGGQCAPGFTCLQSACK